MFRRIDEVVVCDQRTNPLQAQLRHEGAGLRRADLVGARSTDAPPLPPARPAVAARAEPTVILRVRELPLEPRSSSRRGALVVAAAAAVVAVVVGVAVVGPGGDEGVRASVDAGAIVALADAGAPAEVIAASAAVADAGLVVDAGSLERALGGAGTDEGDRAGVDPGAAPPARPTGAPSPDAAPTPVEVVSDAPLKQLLGQSRSRGLRSGDVPAFDAAIVRGQQAARARNKAGVTSSAAAARAALEAVVVDRGFVSEKLARFNRAFADTKDAALKEQLKPLSREVLGRIGKKDWVGANETLNTGFTKLAKGR
jgi:hypothetical protein